MLRKWDQFERASQAKNGSRGIPGLGYVDVYSSSGRLLRRLQHGDWLNAPWGVTLAPLDFGRFSHDLLIGQFAGGGDTNYSGVIAAYDLATGRFDGLLEDASGKSIVINGIWALSPGNVSPGNLDSDEAPAARCTLLPDQTRDLKVCLDISRQFRLN